MYKIYLDKRFIVLSGQPDRMQKYCLFHKYHDNAELYKKISEFLYDGNIDCLNIYSYKINTLFSAFSDFFENRTAAGGLIINRDKKMLLIKRHGKWDIPKGHISGNESVEECARREIEEETGLVPASVIKTLKPGHHIYQTPANWVLKKTHWFVFSYEGGGSACPQEEEGIESTRWFSRDELTEVHNNTWSSISDVLYESLAEFFDK